MFKQASAAPFPPFFFHCLLDLNILFLVFWQMSSNYDLGHSEIRKITASGHVSAPACVATAGTALIIGFVPKYQFQQSILLLDFLET